MRLQGQGAKRKALKVSDQSEACLTENDFFGDIYPFEAEKIFQSYFETTAVTELIKRGLVVVFADILKSSK
jgi:hypothetical protein